MASAAGPCDSGLLDGVRMGSRQRDGDALDFVAHSARQQRSRNDRRYRCGWFRVYHCTAGVVRIDSAGCVLDVHTICQCRMATAGGWRRMVDVAMAGPRRHCLRFGHHCRGTDPDCQHRPSRRQDPLANDCAVGRVVRVDRWHDRCCWRIVNADRQKCTGLAATDRTGARRAREPADLARHSHSHLARAMDSATPTRRCDVLIRSSHALTLPNASPNEGRLARRMQAISCLGWP